VIFIMTGLIVDLEIELVEGVLEHGGRGVYSNL
jgi:hypothetical protein